jgi:hypothetical protein
LDVWSLNILPKAKQIMSERMLPHPLIGDIMSWTERSYDTVLMLMNGIGMVGTPQRLDDFLHRAHRLCAAGGQILCDSIDVSVAQAPVHIRYRAKNIEHGLYAGQQRFRIRYEGVMGDSFDWLHIDFLSLARHSRAAGWNCQLILEETDGHYLARISRV